MTSPRVPSRTWADPLLGCVLHTGEDALHAFETMAPGTHIATDIETPGLVDSFTINCVTVAWHGVDGRLHTALLDPRRDERHHRRLHTVYRLAGTIILHNAPFDIPPLHHAGLLTLDQIEAKIVDTVVLARFALPADVRNGGIAKNLTTLALKFLGWSEFKGGMERAFKAAGYKTIEAGFEGMDIGSPIYRQGAMLDTVATLLLEPTLRQMCIEWTLDHGFDFYGATTHAEAAAILRTHEVTHRVMLRRSALGLNVDREYLDQYRQRVADEQVLAAADLASVGLEGGSGKGAKLVEYLDSIGELPAGWPRTPTRKLSSAKAHLDMLDHPLAKAQRFLAETEKVMGYLGKVERQSQVTGRCHPQVGTLAASATGRMSYNDPPLQQFSADARGIICDDGQGLTSIDWSQIEPVTMGNMARDLEFLAAYEAGDDLYEPLQLAAGLPLTKEGRNGAKVLLLSTMYGAGIAKIAAQVGHTEESAAQLKRQMFSAMKKCERWMHKVEEVAREHGRVLTAGGRILPVDDGGIFKAVNYTVQGSAYDVLAHTIETLHDRGLSRHVQLAMHDELVVDTEAAEEVQHVMATPPPFLVKWAGGRMPVLRTDRADMGAGWQKV